MDGHVRLVAAWPPTADLGDIQVESRCVARADRSLAIERMPLRPALGVATRQSYDVASTEDTSDIAVGLVRAGTRIIQPHGEHVD